MSGSTQGDIEISRLGDNILLVRRGPNPRTGDDRVLKVPAGEFPIVQDSPGSILSDMVERLRAENVEQEERIKVLEAAEVRIMGDAILRTAALEGEIAEQKALREDDAEIRSSLYASARQAEARLEAAQGQVEQCREVHRLDASRLDGAIKEAEAEERALLARCEAELRRHRPVLFEDVGPFSDLLTDLRAYLGRVLVKQFDADAEPE